VRILVTGGTGFIGRHLIAHARERHEIVALTRSEPPEDLLDGVDWREQDLREPLRGLPDRVDGIVHLAQSPRYQEFPDGAQDVYAVNVHSTFRLLEWARTASAGTFVLVSTGGLYPYADAPVSEEADVRPGGFYFRAKYAAEVLLGAYAEQLRAVVLRPFFVYGEGQRRMLIARLADQIAAGEEIVIDGDPGLRCNPLHVEDMVRVFEPALTAPVSGIINVAGPDVVSMSALVAALGEALGCAPSVRHRTASAPGDLVAAVERMRTDLGVTPRVRLEDGLRRVAAALRSPQTRGR
jgi:nucleoside-diphosphate-sugar epimerase